MPQGEAQAEEMCADLLCGLPLTSGPSTCVMAPWSLRVDPHLAGVGETGPTGH